MDNRELEDRLSRIATLEEPMRRAIYFHVAGQPCEVSRDQVATALQISRSLAAFHLDRLVRAGLLDATFRRLSDRRGPGAGRPSKLYCRSAQAVEVSVPERRYELAGQLMSQALSEAGTPKAVEGLFRVAREWGERIGSEARGRSDSDKGRLLKRVVEVLRGVGFEPRREGTGQIVLQNCPFEGIARASRELICGMNLALIQGVVKGLQMRDISARLEPRPGRCCVVIGSDATA